MKKNVSIILLSCIISAIFAGCGNQTVVKEQMAPNGYWGDSNWDFVGGIFL